MGTFEIIKRNGERIPLFSREPFCTVRSAVQNSSLMGDDNVQLSIVSSEILSFSKGDKIIVNGEEYAIRTTVNREVVSDSHFVYEATFYGVMYELMKSLYRNTDANGKSTSNTFDLTYSIRDFVKVLIYNVNRDYPGLWVFDEENCPDTEPRTISFSKNNCLQVLQTLCSEFRLEFRITQSNGVRTIHIGKFGSRVTPPAGNDFFEWGKGNGLYNLREQKVDDKAIITRLWVEGGTTNIRSNYRNYSERLQLPYPQRLNKNAHTLADGTVVAAGSELIGISDDNNRYLEDADLRDMIGSDEDAKTYDDIFPKRTGEVTALVDGDLNSFIDSSMNFDLNEKDAEGNTKYLIDSITAKISFISGKLAGQQFELATKDGYDHSTKKFTLIAFTDKRGLTIPTTDSEAYRIQVGDKYKITDINLPKSYEDDAEEDLWYAGKQYFVPMTQARAQYQLTLDRGYFLDSMPADSETCVFKVGDYVPVKDTRFGIHKSIRIQKVTRNLLLEHDYSLTLSDTTAISIQSQTVLDVINHEKIIENNRLKDLNKARRGWRTTEELRTMVYDTDGYFDTENIRPNSIDTNMLTVGSKSQQFILIGVVLQANVGGNGNRFNATAGTLAHLTIDNTQVRQWAMSAAEVTLESEMGYFVFAKCSKEGNTGVWYVTQEQLKFETSEDPNNYYFQVGIISSLYPGDEYRDFATTYGFTRINGNTITTGKIVTSDGECYLDLDGNKFRIGDASSSIDWNVSGRNQIALKNVVLVSGSGDISNIGVYRGVYNSEYVYYNGDEVSYTANGETCTYRYINENPSRGNVPTNSAYWALVAKGATGETGETGMSIYYTFHDSIEKPATPTGNGTTNGWHHTSTDAVRWMSIKTAKTINDGTWGEPIRVRGADGTSITVKGTVASVADLPTTGNTQGDAYLLNGNLYIWDGTTWQNMGQIKGDPGTSSYLHVKYSDDGGVTFTAGNGETPGRWIGMLVNNDPTDSDTPSDYTWNDTQGEQGIPGEPGEDGRTTYLHLKYSNDGGLSFTANNGEEPGAYIGQYTDYELYDSDNPEDYTWSKIQGNDGIGGADGSSGDFYEYRYAKNGSTQEPPELDATAINPVGWSLEQPVMGEFEYLWYTNAKKSGIVDKTKVHIPITSEDPDVALMDQSGNGYNGVINRGSIIQSGERYALDLSGNGEATIPYNLPFGDSFTLCFWFKTNQSVIKWMMIGYNGRDYVEKNIETSPGEWIHFGFRFNGRSVVVYKNGVFYQSGSINNNVVGFSIYDDNMFGSDVYYDDVRIVSGSLAVSDIEKIIDGSADRLLQNWSTPIRITPYDGIDGEDGVAVSVEKADVEYAISDSNTEAPVTGWSTTAPQWVDGKYIWSRTRVDYSDNTTTYTNAVCITGGKGETGSPGGDGLGVSSIVEQYYLSSSAYELLNGSWSSSYPEWKDGWYIWTRSVITYTNGTSTTTDAVCVTGGKGETGAAGISILTVDVEYAKSTSNTIAPVEGWSTDAPIWENGKYIWSRNKTVYSNNESSYSNAVCITGGVGSDGKGVSSIVEQYYHSTSPTSLSGGSWSTTRPVWEDGKYIWTRSVITYTDGTITTTSEICVTGGKGEQGIQGLQGIQGERGEQGVPGKNGTDGKTTYFHIKYSSVSNPTSSLQMTETPSAYIGTYVDYTQADSTNPSKYTWSKFQGSDGADGIPGTNGEDGITYYLHIAYATSANGSTGFSTTNSVNKTYIGQYTDTVKADSTDPSKYKWTKIKGDKGDPGEDGNGISEIIEYYLATSASSGVTVNTTGWTTSIQQISAGKPYLWNYELITYTKSNSVKTAPVIIGRYGKDGTNGTNGSDGRGIVSITEYYAKGESGTTPPSTGWSTTPPELDPTKKYMWNYETITYTTGSPEDTTKVVIGVYGAGLGSNILRQADFESSAKMNMWDIRNGSIVDGVNGKNGFTDNIALSAETFTELLKQVLNDATKKLIDPSKWYTLSFYAKGKGAKIVNVNQTSNKYGFASKTFYAEKDATVTVKAMGYCSQNALNGGCVLAVYVYTTDWSFSRRIDITSTTSKEVSITFISPISGTYKVSSFCYKSSQVGGDASLGETVTIQRYSVNRRNRLHTYVYSATNQSNIDLTAGYIKDGITYSSGGTGDGCVVWELSEQWERHTFSFKTRSVLPTMCQVLFRLFAGNNGATICMPKVEEGNVATAYVQHSEDLKGDKGDKGDSPVLVFRGLYDSTATYYGNSTRLDAVEYNNLYYIARIDAGAFSGVIPTDTDKWNTFGNQFESVATKLLLAKYATIQDIVITGQSVFTGNVRKSKTIITPDNYQEYSECLELGLEYRFNFDKCGSWMEFTGSSVPVSFMMPGVGASYTFGDNARQHVGSVILVYNRTNDYILFTGANTNTEGVNTFVSIAVNSGELCKFECKLWADSDGNEVIGWIYSKMKIRD